LGFRHPRSPSRIRLCNQPSLLLIRKHHTWSFIPFPQQSIFRPHHFCRYKSPPRIRRILSRMSYHPRYRRKHNIFSNRTRSTIVEFYHRFCLRSVRCDSRTLKQKREFDYLWCWLFSFPFLFLRTGNTNVN